METVTIVGIKYTLESLENDIWLRLLNGSLRYKDAFHQPAVANLNKDGINIRIVVLRKVNTVLKQLAFYTDIRSGKWQEIQQQHKLSWLFYDDILKMQIRLSGFASLHQIDALADDAWAGSSLSSRKIYLGNIAPSTTTPIPVSGVPEAFETLNPTIEESIEGRKNFGVVVTDICWMEWVWLNSAGNRRASFKYAEDKNFTAEWLVP